MKIDDAAKDLAKMYRDGIPNSEQAVSVHLFGIKFAPQLDGIPLKEIAIRAGIAPAYATEIHVQLKSF